MTGGSSPEQSSRELVEIDTSVPNAARVYDYLLGGDANFAIDREAAEREMTSSRSASASKHFADLPLEPLPPCRSESGPVMADREIP